MNNFIMVILRNNFKILSNLLVGLELRLLLLIDTIRFLRREFLTEKLVFDLHLFIYHNQQNILSISITQQIHADLTKIVDS